MPPQKSAVSGPSIAAAAASAAAPAATGHVLPRRTVKDAVHKEMQAMALLMKASSMKECKHQFSEMRRAAKRIQRNFRRKRFLSGIEMARFRADAQGVGHFRGVFNDAGAMA